MYKHLNLGSDKFLVVMHQDEYLVIRTWHDGEKCCNPQTVILDRDAFHAIISSYNRCRELIDNTFDSN